MSLLEGVRRLVRRCTRVTLTVVKYGCIIHCVSNYGFAIAVCSGESMEPTIHDGAVYLVEAFSVYTFKIKVGDVVGIRSHDNPNQFICKRIIGMYGDPVWSPTQGDIVHVPKGHIWIEGDNKGQGKSCDSREYGPIPYGLIQYRLIKQLYSVGKWDKKPL